MGKDWNEPRDTGPPIEEPDFRWKKKKGKKPYVIESMREADPDSQFVVFSRGWSWKVYSRYTTEKGRDQALKTLINKSQNSPLSYFKLMKFRKGTP